jgi:uncharacterized protein YdhG (YjbR/CyaY superfamily)
MTTVEAYISHFPPPVQERLEAFRAIILRLAPGAWEGMAYGMPAYKTHGKPLVYFAAFQHHIGCYATPSGHAAFARELAGYKQGKGSVQFPHDQPLPLELIERIVAFRVRENDARSVDQPPGRA